MNTNNLAANLVRKKSGFKESDEVTLERSLPLNVSLEAGNLNYNSSLGSAKAATLWTWRKKEEQDFVKREYDGRFLRRYGGERNF